jgi:hypothetical protein
MLKRLNQKNSGSFSRPMYRFQWILLAILAGSASLSEARERRLLELPTRDFTIYSALPEKQTRYFASNMATFDRVVAGMGGVATRRSAGPTRIFLVSAADWQEYLRPSENIDGLFTDASGISNDLVVPVKGTSVGTYPVIFHEYSHFIVRTQFPGYCPPWFDEGLAELLSTAQFREDRIVLKAPRDRLYSLQVGPWIPADAFFRVRHDSREYQSHQLAPSFYAQAWLTMNYAFVVEPAFLRQLVEYVLRLNRGEPEDAAAGAAFQRPLHEVDRDLRAYGSQRVFRDGEILARTDREVIAAPARMLSAAESARELGELAGRMQRPPERVQELFTQARQGLPGDLRTRAGLASALAAKKDGTAAKELLKDISLESVTDATAARALGDAQTAIATMLVPPDKEGQFGVADKEWTRAARASYAHALRYRPDDLAAAHGYAYASIELKEDLDDAIAVLERAQKAAPVSWKLALGLAVAHGEKGSTDAAVQQFQQVARLARSPELRDAALKVLSDYREAVAGAGEAP